MEYPTTPTPRKGFFTKSESDVVPESVMLLMGDASESGSGSSTTTLYQLLNEERRGGYEDQGLVGRWTLIGAFFVAVSVLVIMIWVGQDPSDLGRHGSTTASSEVTMDTPEHSSPHHSHAMFSNQPDLHEQCHDYYATSKEMHHLETYFEEGSHEPVEMEGFAKERGDGVCERSLTYFLDATFGLFFHLTAISQAYAFSILSHRAFFIVDENWDRGKWTDHFQLLPDQGCSLPKFEEMKGCPRGTRHWALDGQVLHYHFGKEYRDAFLDESSRMEMSRRAFEDILVPSDTNAALIRLARRELFNASVEAGAGGRYLGMHLRRGDRHPMEWEFHKSYIPLERFRSKALAGWDSEAVEDPSVPETAFIHLASTSPSTVDGDFENVKVHSLLRSTSPELRQLATDREYRQQDFQSLDIPTRIQQTRGAIVDFDLLAGGWPLTKSANLMPRHADEDPKPVAVLCTVSSNVCKLAAIAMGWDRAIGQERWINLDGEGDGFGWRPTEVP